VCGASLTLRESTIMIKNVKKTLREIKAVDSRQIDGSYLIKIPRNV